MKIRKKDLKKLIENYLNEEQDAKQKFSNSRFTVFKADFRQFIELIFEAKKTGLHQKMIDAAADFGAPFDKFAALMYDGMEAEDDWQQTVIAQGFDFIGTPLNKWQISSHGIGQLTWKAGAKMVKAHLADNTWSQTSKKFAKYVKNKDDKAYLALLNNRGKGPVELESDDDVKKFSLIGSKVYPEISSKKILDIIEGLSDDMNLAVSAAYFATNAAYEEYIGALSGISDERKNRLEFIEKNVEKLAQFNSIEEIKDNDEYSFFFSGPSIE